MVYPLAVLGRAPPVRFGRRVEAKGARVVRRLTALPIEDLGKAERLYLTAPDGPVLMNRRTAALTVLWVVYHLPLFWRSNAAGWIGCLGLFRTSTGCNSLFNERDTSAMRALTRSAVL